MEDETKEQRAITEDVLHIATYYNTIPDLPDTVEEQNITWPDDLDGDLFTVCYSVVEVEGVCDDGTVVTAKVEVVPQSLKYQKNRYRNIKSC